MGRPLRKKESEALESARAEREHAEYEKSPTPKGARVSYVAFATVILFVFLSDSQDRMISAAGIV